MRRNFSSSGLVRLLGDLDPTPHTAPAKNAIGPTGQDFAEQLSRWVGVFEAGTLHAVHQAVGTATGDVPDAHRARPGQAVALKEHLHQVRTILSRAATSRDLPDTGLRRGRQVLTTTETAPAPEVDFAPYRQRYTDQQRNMDLMIGPLRDNARQTLSATSPALRQLAALDAAWEQLLAGREQKLMATVPLRLKRRFDQLRKTHTPIGDDAASPDTTQDPSTPGPWLDTFSAELQQILLAELEMRLQPVTGLIEAFEQEG